MAGYFPKGAEILFIGTNPGQLNKRQSGWDDTSYSDSEEWSEFQRGYAKGLFEAPMGKWIQKGMNDRRDWAFTNIVKCRTPDNAPPSLEEISTCRPWLQNQIKLTKPKIIITLGASAYNWFDTIISMDRVRGMPLSINNLFFTGILIPMDHPAYQRYKHDKFTAMSFKKVLGLIENRKAYRAVMASNRI